MKKKNLNIVKNKKNHKINHIKAAFVIAIALTLIVPIAPVFADTNEQSGETPTLFNGKMMIVENTSAYMNDTGHLTRINGTWPGEVFAYEIYLLYDSPLPWDFLTVTDINLNGTVAENAEYSNLIVNDYGNLVDVRAIVWYSYNLTPGNGIPAGSGVLLNIVQDIHIDAWPQVVNITESPLDTSRYYIYPQDPSPLEFINGQLEILNSVPITPGPPEGPDSGIIGDVYAFNVTTTDPEGHDIQYKLDFGDEQTGYGPLIPSGEIYTRYNAWDNPGVYDVKVRAKDFYTHQDNPEIEWSEPLTVTIIDPTDYDLDCSGSLSWTDIEPGATVTGSFIVENIGGTGSLLDWEIESYPEWGTWTFDPDSGTDLTPEDGAITVDVEVVAPDESNTEFTGEIKVVNSDDPNDFCTIDVALVTPVSQHSLILWVLNWLATLFPVFAQIFTAIL